MANIRPPFLVSYSITTKCNLACRHCYSDSIDSAAADELSTEEAFRVIDSLAQWGIGLLIFDGGEPLCRDDFLDLARHASGRDIRVVVGSNGTLIDRPTAKAMVEAGIRAVAISIDGANAETHDPFRGKEGAFHQALEGAAACKAEGLPFQFNMVLRSAVVPQVSEMLRLAVESGANAAEFFDLSGSRKGEAGVPRGRAINSREAERYGVAGSGTGGLPHPHQGLRLSYVSPAPAKEKDPSQALPHGDTEKNTILRAGMCCRNANGLPGNQG